jgi:signal peptidase I
MPTLPDREAQSPVLEGPPARCQHTPLVRARKEDLTRFYRGPSMAGTFRPGDSLVVENTPLDRIRPGDVVVFRGNDTADAPQQVVHRTIAALPEGLVTRGDNNLRVDGGLVTSDRLLGRVTHLVRAGKTRPVRGGWWGLLRVRALRCQRLARQRGRRLIAVLGRRPYRWLRNSGLVPRLWQPPVTRVQLATEDGPVVKYICHGRTVARYWPESGRFQCRKPYDLVVSRPGHLQAG